MPHWKKSFPSKYLQASELDTPFVATVKQVVDENVASGDSIEMKPVVYWEEEGFKPVVLNITRGEALADLAKNDYTENWPGTRVLVRRGMTRYQGKRVPCIEFAAPPPAPQAPPTRKLAKPASLPPAPVNLGEPFEEPLSEEEAF